jgi:hypothetical protein
MEGINSFEKGLHRSNSPSEQPEGSYVDALNWIRNDSGRLINEEVEELVQTLPNHILLGYTPVNDEFICFFQVNGTDSEIGTFSKGVYAKVFNDFTPINGVLPSYKLNFKKEIDCVARVINTGERVVYFVEEDNPIRRFNLDEYLKSLSTPTPAYNVLKDFNLLLDYTMPYCTLDVKTGGGLSSGVYSIVLRYRTEQNNKTICNIPSKFISITDGEDLRIIYSDKIDGCAPGTQTDKSIHITTKHVDTNYPYIEPIVITYTGTANNLVIKSLGVYDNIENNVIIFSDELQLKEDVPTVEITENAFFYESAKCIEQKDNVLILSNLTSKKYDNRYQDVANKIKLVWYVEKYTLYSPRAINSAGKVRANNPELIWDYRGSSIANVPTQVFYDPFNSLVIDATDYWQSNIYQDPTVKKGFTRGEVYSFSITPIYNDGSIGFAYHIPAQADTTTVNRLKVWTSAEEYPDYMKQYNFNSNNYIQHHQMPDFDQTGPLGGHTYDTLEEIYQNSYINILRVKAEDIDFGPLTSFIQGYIIGYQQRNSDLNTSIIDYGFIRPYMQENFNANYIPSFFSGNSYFFTENVAWSIHHSLQSKSKYWMYHSPDTTYLDKTLSTSYSIEKIGYSVNQVPNYYDNANANNTVRYDIPYLTASRISNGLAYGSTSSYKFEYAYKWEYTDGTFSTTYYVDNLEVVNASYNASYTRKNLFVELYIVAKPISFDLYIKPNRSLISVASRTIPVISDTSTAIVPILQKQTITIFDNREIPTVDYSGSTNRLFVFEGIESLVYDGVGTTPGTWKVNSHVATNVATVTISSTASTNEIGSYARISALSGLTANSANVVFNITGSKKDGTSFTTTITLLIYKKFPTDNSLFLIEESTYNIRLILNDNTDNIDRPFIIFHSGSLPLTPQTYNSYLPLLLGKTATNDNNPRHYLFFEEGKFIHCPNDAKKIEEVVFVPDVSAAGPVQLENAEIKIVEASKYVHLRVDKTGNYLIDDTFLNQYLYRGFSGTGNNLQYRIFMKDGVSTANVVNFYMTETITIPIARIVNRTKTQYSTLQRAEYIPSIVRFDNEVLNNNPIEIEGDTYVCKTFMNRYDFARSNGATAISTSTGEDIGAYMIIGFFVESQNNLALRYQETNTGLYYPQNRTLKSPDPNRGVGILDVPHTSWVFSYNKQYSKQNNVKVNITIPSFFKEVTKFPNRSIYSYTAFESDIVDRYRIFPSNQFHDIPKDRGEITDTFVFNNTFFHHTEYGLWQSYFNPNTIQSTTQGDVVLGNAGIFRIPSKLILDIKGGYMGTLDKSGTNTPFGRVFLDHAQGKIFLFSGEAPIEISDLGLFSYFREFVNTTDKYSMGYDWANKRLLISQIGKKAISFYPKTQTWTSLHDFVPTSYLTLNGSSYAWQDSSTSFYNLSNSNDRRKNSYITFVENTQPDAFKRFDRIEMNTMSGGSGGIVNPGSIPDATNYTFNNNSFTHIHTWTDRQNSTELVFAYSNDYNTNFLNSYDPSKVPVNYYKSSFHAELPLDAVIDPNKNIFDNRLFPQGNLDINTDFRTHMKGKFLYTKLSYKNIGNTIVDKPLVLNYVKTFFKPTVA